LNTNRGFTLVELIIIIVILSILYVFAAPKMLSTTTSARISILKSTEQTISTAIDLISAKAMINGLYENRGVGSRGTKLDFNDIEITIYNKGTPREIWLNGFEYLISGDIYHLGSGTGQIGQTCIRARLCVIDHLKVSNIITGKEGYGLFIFPKGYKLSDKSCFVYYSFQIDTQGLLVYRETGLETRGC